MLFLLISSSLIISLPFVYGAGGTVISNAVELTTGKTSETWTSGTDYYKINLIAGQTLSLNVDLISGTDIDLYLLDPDSSDSVEVLSIATELTKISNLPLLNRVIIL